MRPCVRRRDDCARTAARTTSPPASAPRSSWCWHAAARASRATLLAEQLVGSLRAGFSLLAVSLDLHVNAGMCCAPDHGNAAEDLLRHVHTALEDAGEARGRIASYRPGREEELRRRLALAGDLRGAIERDELTLVYQPKVDLANGRVRSLEALARWTHPQLGAVSPGEFVPIAEQTGGARRLTSWALGAAIRQMAAWRREGIEIDVAVNLSAPDLLDSQLGDEILETLRQHGVAPDAADTGDHRRRRDPRSGAGGAQHAAAAHRRRALFAG